MACPARERQKITVTHQWNRPVNITSAERSVVQRAAIGFCRFQCNRESPEVEVFQGGGAVNRAQQLATPFAKWNQNSFAVPSLGRG